MTPNPSETPTSSQELAAVLAEIAEIEEAPGYMGPHVARAIKEARWIFEMAEDVEYEVDEYGHRARVSIPDEWLWDIVVGEIGRACDALGYHWEGGRCDEPTGCIFGISRVAPGYDGDHPVQRHKYLIAEETGDSLALAAARAYLAAIQETRE